MKRLFLIITLTFPLISLGQSYDKVFINGKDLSQKLGKENLLIIHVDGPSGYDQGHIPGALPLTSNDFTTRQGDIVFELPEASSFSETLASIGVDQESEIVICSGWDSFEYAYRLYYTLDYFGLGANTRVLDGGIRQWSLNNYEITTNKSAANPSAAPSLRANPAKLVSKDWIRKNMNNKDVKILDARVEAFYTGKSGSFTRGGHIPGSGRVTWINLVDDNHNLAPRDELLSMFAASGAEGVKTVATYCHIGLRASVLYTVAKSLGYDAMLYDGSMNEWETLSDDYPVARGKSNN